MTEVSALSSEPSSLAPEAMSQPALGRQTPSAIPGIALCVAIAAIAVFLGRAVPIVGAPVFGILLGIALANILRLPAATLPGSRFCSKKVLQAAIIVLGGSLSLTQVMKTGGESLAVMLVTLTSALVAAWVLGRVLKVGPTLTGLIGVGTGICGGSAIAAVAPIVEADDDEIAFSISTVFLFNVVAVIVFPLLGHLMAMTQTGFGLWAGTAINDTSSVVAAAYSYGQDAGDYATVTKLARTTMIVPICIALAFLMSRRRCDGTKCDLGKTIPWFILGFLALSVLNTAGVLGEPLAGYCGVAGKHLIVIALAGVGLGANLRKIVKTGPRPILLGLLVWVIVAATSLLVQTLAGQM